ncbi:MAG: sulfatase-like hydrolase/transferase [Lentisphaeria bacterium]|nr:sulfatase-like hydrolase/transferase [Lentisphaeria bacterium]
MCSEKLKTFLTEKNITPTGIRKFFSLRLTVFIATLTLSWLFRFTADVWAFDNSCFRGMAAVGEVLSAGKNYLALLQSWILWCGIYALGCWTLPEKVNNVLLAVFVAAEVLLSVTDCFMVVRYSCPMKDMIVILRATDQQEIREYFSAMFGQGNAAVPLLLSLLVLIVSGGVFYLLHKLKTAPERAVSAVIFFFCAALTLFFPGESTLRDHPDPLWSFAVNFNTRDHFLTMAARTTASPVLPPEVKDILTGNATPVYGIVIAGESDSRARHSLYGHNKDTDIFLRKSRASGMICFTDTISATASTMHSIYFMFTNARILNKYAAPDYGICEYIRHAGGTVSLHDMQRSHGAWSSMMALLFANADRKRAYSDDGKNHFDGELLVPVCNEITAAGDRQAQLLVLHLMGSHYDQNFRVPEAWKQEHAKFLTGMDAYDRSIVYTGFILSRIHAATEKITRPAFVLYIPDHSEEPLSRRSMTTPEAVYYEIPMLLYFNAAYRKQFPQTVALARKAAAKPFQTDLSLPLIARLMQIPEQMIAAEDDLLSPAYRPPRRKVAWGEEDYIPFPPIAERRYFHRINKIPAE